MTFLSEGCDPFESRVVKLNEETLVVCGIRVTNFARGYRFFCPMTSRPGDGPKKAYDSLAKCTRTVSVLSSNLSLESCENCSKIVVEVDGAFERSILTLAYIERLNATPEKMFLEGWPKESWEKYANLFREKVKGQIAELLPSYNAKEGLYELVRTNVLSKIDCLPEGSALLNSEFETEFCNAAQYIWAKRIGENVLSTLSSQ
jgi:hypothetical protein